MENQPDLHKYISKEVIQRIVTKHSIDEGEIVDCYSVSNASDKMLGFLCDYWKVRVKLKSKRTLNYFFKVISVTNKAKADTVQELDLLGKEMFFYEVIKEKIKVPGLKPWSAEFITGIEIALVFQDLEAIGYKLRDKFKTFDKSHTLEALKTLVRFHASSIIFEEKETKKFGQRYFINEYFGTQLGKAGYEDTDPWYLQCMYGALEGLKKFSKYTEEEMKSIEDNWKKVWLEALSLSDPSSVYKNVICHRDLWNNNIIFHYTDGQPDDCILVDFQAARYQPPAGDVMLLLYSNLNRKFREDNLDFFLNFYIEELHQILEFNGVTPDRVSKENFFESAREQRKWGIVIWACLLPLAWINDEDTLKYFSDTAKFDYIVTKNKASFIIEMMESSEDYKEKLMDVFEEIVERYCR